MKRNTIILFFLAAVTCFSFRYQEPACNQQELKVQTKKILDPYKYDNAKVTPLKYTDKKQVKEFEAALFIGEKYRFAFNLNALVKPIEVNVYNRGKDSESRKLLFTTKGSTEKEFTYDCSFTRHVFVEYVIEPGPVGESLGCAVFMLGYK
jgi:hypothetical protein